LGLTTGRAEEPGLGGREAAGHEDAVLAVLLLLDVPERVELRDDVIAVVGHEELTVP
jgi:hypothetical protein